MRSCRQAFDATDYVAIITHNHEKSYRNEKPEAVAACLLYIRAILGDEHGLDNGNEYWEITSEDMKFWRVWRDWEDPDAWCEDCQDWGHDEECHISDDDGLSGVNGDKGGVNGSE